MTKIRVAICQHALFNDIDKNYSIAVRQVETASLKGASVAIFPECNLTGYAGIEFNSYSSSGDQPVRLALDKLCSLAKELKIWIIVGGYRFTPELKLPYNSMFVISSKGSIECTYDKRLLTSGDSGDDVDYFSPGNDPVIFKINGIKCGLLICHEWRYPELYREYKRLGVDLIFQSWYDANVNKQDYLDGGKDHGSLIMGAVRSNAANNYLWICGSNASNMESSIGSFISAPDGTLISKLPRNKNGVLVETLDLSKKFIDPSRYNRERFFLDKRIE